MLLELVGRPIQLYLFKKIFRMIFCNVNSPRAIGPRLSLSPKLSFIYDFFRNQNRHQQRTRLTQIQGNEANSQPPHREIARLMITLNDVSPTTRYQLFKFLLLSTSNQKINAPFKLLDKPLCLR